MHFVKVVYFPNTHDKKINNYEPIKYELSVPPNLYLNVPSQSNHKILKIIVLTKIFKNYSLQRKKERGKGERNAHFDCQLSSSELTLVIVKWPISDSAPLISATRSSSSSSLSSSLYGGGFLVFDALASLVFYTLVGALESLGSLFSSFQQP